jgi:hypothetical protein
MFSGSVAPEAGAEERVSQSGLLYFKAFKGSSPWGFETQNFQRSVATKKMDM